MRPLVCVFAHPDDEAFGPGGTIATFAKERDVYLICVTKGNAKKELQDHVHKDLAHVRRGELLASAAILGIKEVMFLDYDDGQLCNNIYHELAGKLSEILLTYQPDTLMTFEPRGITGHIDHITVSMVTSYVFDKTAFVKTLLYFCEAEEIMRELRKEYFIHIPAGYVKDECSFVVDIEEMWETKVEAMQAHKSQQKDVDWTLIHLRTRPKEEQFIICKK